MFIKLNKTCKLTDEDQINHLLSLGYLPISYSVDENRTECVFNSEEIIKDLQEYVCKTRHNIIYYLSNTHRKQYKNTKH